MRPDQVGRIASIGWPPARSFLQLSAMQAWVSERLSSGRQADIAAAAATRRAQMPQGALTVGRRRFLFRRTIRTRRRRLRSARSLFPIPAVRHSAQSCGSCHSPSFGWGRTCVGVGYGMQKLGRRSPTVVNAAWGGIFMWDGRLAT